MSGDEAMRVESKRAASLVDAFLLKPSTLAEIESCVTRAMTRRQA